MTTDEDIARKIMIYYDSVVALQKISNLCHAAERRGDVKEVERLIPIGREALAKMLEAKQVAHDLIKQRGGDPNA